MLSVIQEYAMHCVSLNATAVADFLFLFLFLSFTAATNSWVLDSLFFLHIIELKVGMICLYFNIFVYIQPPWLSPDVLKLE